MEMVESASPFAGLCPIENAETRSDLVEIEESMWRFGDVFREKEIKTRIWRKKKIRNERLRNWHGCLALFIQQYQKITACTKVRFGVNRGRYMETPICQIET